MDCLAALQPYVVQEALSDNSQLDKLVGLAMLVAASVVFLYYSIWTLLMVYTIL